MKLTPIDPAAAQAHTVLTKHAVDRLMNSNDYVRASMATHTQQVIRDLSESRGLEEMMNILCDAILDANERSYDLQEKVIDLAGGLGFLDHPNVQKIIDELPVA